MGLLLVFTGDGKGKTTAALGTLLRAYGHGFKIIIAHFLKSGYYCNEPIGEKLTISSRLSDLVRECFMYDFSNSKEFLNYVIEVTLSEEPNLLILDEANVAINFGFISIDDLLNFLNKIPKNTHVIVTGRYAHSAILERADLITRMECIKHYLSKGITAVKGLDW